MTLTELGMGKLMMKHDEDHHISFPAFIVEEIEKNAENRNIDNVFYIEYEKYKEERTSFDISEFTDSLFFLNQTVRPKQYECLVDVNTFNDSGEKTHEFKKIDVGKKQLYAFKNQKTFWFVITPNNLHSEVVLNIIYICKVNILQNSDAS